MSVRLRFAPSPTGYLHVGGLRTALFAWLYTRRHGGQFIFRLEDTDQNRFVSGAEANLIRTLAWAGIDHDEGPDKGGGHGPYRQSERLELYQQHAQQLVGQGDAYPCFCTPERLEQLRVEQQAKGETPRYDGHCRELATSAADERVATGEAHVIRMKVPETPEILVLDDLVRGRVAIETTQTEDQVIIKSDGFPTYHLAVVVDDHHMAISHCVREKSGCRPFQSICCSIAIWAGSRRSLHTSPSSSIRIALSSANDRGMWPLRIFGIRVICLKR